LVETNEADLDSRTRLPEVALGIGRQPVGRLLEESLGMPAHDMTVSESPGRSGVGSASSRRVLCQGDQLIGVRVGPMNRRAPDDGGAAAACAGAVAGAVGSDTDAHVFTFLEKDVGASVEPEKRLRRVGDRLASGIVRIGAWSAQFRCFPAT
jgi:hypothetical protein